VAVLLQPRRRDRAADGGGGGRVDPGGAAIAERDRRTAPGLRRIDRGDGGRRFLVHSTRLLSRRSLMKRGIVLAALVAIGTLAITAMAVTASQAPQGGLNPAALAATKIEKVK